MSARHCTRALALFALLLVLVYSARAQRETELESLTALVPGTTLPVSLDHGLRLTKVTSGSVISAHTTQRVPVGAHHYLKSGAIVLGVVEQTASVSPQAEQTLTIRFARLRYRGQEIAVTLDAVAVANFTVAADTRLPANGSTDRGNPNPASWTTRQVGGDEVVRSGWSGDVVNTVTDRVGIADFNGVYRLPPATGSSHGTPSARPDFLTALGVFSASAAGLYGYDERLHLLSANGFVYLTGPANLVALHAGDQLLLRVSAPSRP